MRLILLCAFIAIAHCLCPPGLELVRDGECRGKLATMVLRYDNATDVAITKCNEINGQPVIIHDNEQQSYWSNQPNPNGQPFFLLGLTCSSISSKWQWADGSAIDYKPAQYNPKLDTTCSSAMSWRIQPTGNWDYWNGGDYETDIFCTSQIHQNFVDNVCANFADDTEDGVCYQVSTSANDWQDAQMTCKKLGADLASIHNIQENSFVRRLAVSNGAITGLFLGATIIGKGNNFGWIDGSDWDYDNFYPSFPREGFGECIAMDTSTPNGQWMNIDCTEKLPVACIRKQSEVLDPVCSSETWKEGSIVTSPGFPFNASIPCDYYLMVDGGKKVELEIKLLEANTCCDSLILYDGYLGGVVLAKLTGEMSNVTFTTTSSHIMKVSWQPDGGVNVMGLAMTFRGV